MSDAIHITVAGEPVAKGRPRLSARPVGGVVRAMAYTPAKTRRYEAHVRLAAQQAMDGRAPLDGPVVVSVAAYMPIPQSWSQRKQRQAERGEILPTKRPDAENMLKSALDGCNGIVFADDKQAVEVRAIKSYSRRPRLEIRVAPYPAAA